MLKASQGGLSHPRIPQGFLRRAVKPQGLKEGASVSHGRPPQLKMGRQCAVGWSQGLRKILRQAVVRSGQTAGNAGSLPRTPLASQKPPDLSWAGNKAPGLEQGARVTCGRPLRQKWGHSMAWFGRRDSWGTLRQAEGRSGETAWKAGSLTIRPLPSQKPLDLFWASCKYPSFGAVGLCVSQKATTIEHRATGTEGVLDAGRG